MRRMSLRGTGRSRQDFLGNSIHSTVRDKLDNRLKVLVPLKIDDLYTEVSRYAFTEAEWAAWGVLRLNTQFMERVSTAEEVRIKHLDKLDSGQGIYDRVMTINTDVAVPRIPVDVRKLPTYTKNIVHAWLVKHTSFEQERDYILNEITALCQLCTTPGQIKRVWPELFSFMNERGKQKGYAALAKSSYPKGVMTHGLFLDPPKKLQLLPRWQPEKMEWMNDVLAQALVLPEYEDSKRSYPELGRW